MGSDQPPAAIYSSVRSASAAASRSSLDLLDLAYPFSQVDLLPASEFASEAAKRYSRGQPRSRMNEQVLEGLHRHGVLVPLLRVDLASSDPECIKEVSASLTAQQVRNTFISELYRAAAEGRAADPAAAPFQPWPRVRLRTLWPTVETGYLYSRHQLLGLDVASSFVSALRPQREGDGVAWHIDAADRPNEPTIAALRSWRSLAITLAALDTYYWPFITHTVTHDITAWRTALQAFEPDGMLAWLGLTLEQFAAQDQDLRLMAAFRDDMGDFYDLIRRAKADAWKSLRGDALAAMDCRLAADVLDRFRQEVGSATDNAAAQAVPLSQTGLSRRSTSLDAALTRLRLSPYPSLVVGVEGATEYLLVPRVMKLLGIELDRNWIEIVDFGGSSKDLALLARHAAEPVLGRDLGNSVALDRPYTRFLVMVDAENKYKTAADRRGQRKLLLDSLAKNIPAEFRRDLYSYGLRARTVEIVTWGRWPFEFAHFTDRQLAKALLSITQTPHPGGLAAVMSLVHRQRLSESPDIGRVRWRDDRPVSKVALAEETWELLERRIRLAVERGNSGPPIMKAVLRAYEMASSSRGSQIALRRR